MRKFSTLFQACALLSAIVAGTAAPASEACFCTGRGGEQLPLGTIYCLSINGHEITAQCVMSLNNTNWRHLHPGCPSKALSSIASQPSALPS